MKLYFKCIAGMIVFGLIVSYFIIFHNSEKKPTEHFENKDGDYNSLNVLLQTNKLLDQLSNKLNIVSDKVDTIETFILQSDIDGTRLEEEQDSEFDIIEEEDEFDSTIAEEEYDFDENMNDASSFPDMFDTIEEEIAEEQYEGSTIIEGFVDSGSMNCHHL